jgi:hypothetical protein
LDLDLQTLVGVEPHLKQIKTRLRFLHYILKYSTLTLPLHHLNTLWTCVIDNGLTTHEKDRGTHLPPRGGSALHSGVYLLGSHSIPSAHACMHAFLAFLQD